MADTWASVCSKCHKPGELLCCDGCVCVYHLDCLGLRRAPSGDFFCPSCAEVRKNKVVSAAEDKWESICGGCGLGGDLLCCEGCPKAYHVACAGLYTLPKGDFYCVSCSERCPKCGKGEIVEGNHLLCGDGKTSGCDRPFHLVRVLYMCPFWM